MSKPVSRLLRAAVAALCCLAGLHSAAFAQAAEKKKSFDIASGDTVPMLKQFSAQSGEQLLYSVDSLDGVRFNAIKGSYSPREALERMISGTPLIVAVDRQNGALSLVRGNGDPDPNAPRAIATASDRPTSRLTKTEDGTVELDEYEVTGSRIRGLVGAATINPVVSYTRTDLERAGVTSVGELSRLIPQVYSQGSYDGIGFGGQNQGLVPSLDGSTVNAVSTARTTFNLRGLGAQNTLILVNGRRLAKTGVDNGAEAADIAGIPVASIERIEVLLGGASAIYGSDATGGVINLILRKNYSGGEVNLSYENTFSSDTAVRTASVSYGLTKGKLGLQFSGNVQDRQAFGAVDRTFAATDDWIQLGGTAGFSNNIGSSFAGGNFATGAGIIATVSGNFPGRSTGYALIPDGANGSAPASAYTTIAPSTLLFGLFPLFPEYTGDRAPFMNMISPQRTRGASVRANYRLTNNHDLFLEGRYSDTRTEIEGMPVNYRNALTVPADYPGNPFGVSVRLNKTFWELGPLQGQKTALTSNADLTAGLRGSLPFADWRYDASIGWNRGKTEDKDAFDPVFNTAVGNALIAARQLVLFYDSRTRRPNDLATLRSMLRNGARRESNVNTTVSAAADGSVWQLPAGPIRLAIGGEHRREEADTWRAATTTAIISGVFHREAAAAFAEVRVPVVSEKQGIPLLHSLELTAAARYDSYSDMGSDVSPGGGVIWRPAKWALVRASRNHGFRAPSLLALYRPSTTNTITVSSVTIPLIDRARNNQAIPVGWVYMLTSGGNPNLKPEQSVSDNVGLVLEYPGKLLKGLSFSMDYQVLHFTDQISVSVSTQTLLDFFPERITRGANLPGDPAGIPGFPTAFDARSINIAQLEVQTIDYQVSYRRSTTWGEFEARAALTDYMKYLATALPGATPTSTLNRFPSRLSWQTYWTNGPWGAGISGFYQEKQYRDLTYRQPQFHSALEWNVQLAYDFDRNPAFNGDGSLIGRGFLKGTKLSLTVNNVFDREPPHAQGRAGFAVTDPRMARYILSLTKRF